MSVPHQNSVFLFNPQNDLALANGSPTFTPPKSALDLAVSGACLPMWYGERGDYFIGAVNALWYDSICNAFGIETTPTMRVPDNVYPSPWGWSPATLRYLKEFGFDEKVLPSVEQVADWRTMSSRATSVPLISDIIEKSVNFISGDKPLFKPRIAHSVEEALCYIDEIGVAMLKLPWSNSGRGQQVSDRTTPEELLRRITGMLNRQGAIEITPLYNKTLDFAMLWDKGVFIGYSLFTTDSHGGWIQNILMSDDEIEKLINETVGRHINFKENINIFTAILKEFSSKFNYTSPIGVDFLISQNDDGCNIVPIEINWRRTMGHVSHKLANQYIFPGNKNFFRILPSSTLKAPFHHVTDCIIENQRLISGELDITPPGGAFRFLLTCEAKS